MNFFKNKKNIIFIILLILSVISVVWILSVINSGNNTQNTESIPVKFKLTRTIPKDNSTNEFPVGTAIEFDFNKEIDIQTLVLNTTPKTETTFNTNSNKTVLYVRAVGGWKINTPYLIIVDVKDSDGQSLDEKIKLNFTLTQPTSSEMNEIPVGGYSFQ